MTESEEFNSIMNKVRTFDGSEWSAADLVKVLCRDHASDLIPRLEVSGDELSSALSPEGGIFYRKLSEFSSRLPGDKAERFSRYCRDERNMLKVERLIRRRRSILEEDEYNSIG